MQTMTFVILRGADSIELSPGDSVLSLFSFLHGKQQPLHLSILFSISVSSSDCIMPCVLKLSGHACFCSFAYVAFPRGRSSPQRVFLLGTYPPSDLPRENHHPTRWSTQHKSTCIPLTLPKDVPENLKTFEENIKPDK